PLLGGRPWRRLSTRSRAQSHLTKTAVIVVDMQNDFGAKDGMFDLGQPLVPSSISARLGKAFRPSPPSSRRASPWCPGVERQRTCPRRPEPTHWKQVQPLLLATVPRNHCGLLPLPPRYNDRIRFLPFASRVSTASIPRITHFRSNASVR